MDQDGTGTKGIENLSDQAYCKAQEVMNRCSEKKVVDPDLRKIVTENLDRLHLNFKQSKGIIKYNKGSSSSPTSDLKKILSTEKIGFMANFSKYDILPTHGARKYNQHFYDPKFPYNKVPRNAPIVVKSNIHTFLGKSGSIDQYEGFKEKLVDEYLQFQSKYECRKGVYFDSTPIATGASLGGDIPSCIASEKEAQAVLKNRKDEIIKEILDRSTGQAAIDTNLSCGGNLKIRNYNVPYKESPSCVGKFTNYFPDREWRIDDEKLKSTPEYAEFKSCIDDMKKNNMELDRIDIKSSASQVNNTNRLGNGKYEIISNFFEDGKPLCSKGFLDLSKARAGSAKSLLQTEFGFKNEEFKINARGTNGNGTSGPCPYKANSSSYEEAPIKEYSKSGSKAKEMSDARYVKVKIFYKPKYSYGEPRKKKCYKIVMSCERLKMMCRGESVPQRGWPKTKRNH